MDRLGNPPLLDVDEMAEQLSISEDTVRRLVRSRKIPYYRAGGQLRFDRAEVLAALRGEGREVAS